VILPYYFLGLGIFRNADLQVGSLEIFAEQSLKAVRMYLESPGGDLFALFPIIYLLNSHKFPCQYSTLSLERLKAFTKFVEDDFYQFVNIISNITSFGKANQSEVDYYVLSDIKSKIALYSLLFLRNYKFEEGLVSIRAMNYLKMSRSKAFRQALDYVLFQQSTDGHFGLYGDEVKKINKNKPKFNPTTQIYLPLTVSTIWTVAEIIKPDFSLFNSFRTR
jgi:hypothetical protein